MEPVDLEVEAVELSRESMQAYVEVAMALLEKVAEITRFIEKTAAVGEMMRVPINLDMLCSCWDQVRSWKTQWWLSKEDNAMAAPTTTEFYQAMVWTLWRKDILALEKCDRGERLPMEVLRAVGDTVRLERLVQAEMC